MSNNFRFYYGAASGSARKALQQLEEPNIMINYATRMNEPWEDIENLFIDSGGYSFMLGKGQYSTTDREYLSFIERVNPELFALRDYPCEPEVLDEYGRTVRQHQRWTMWRHLRLLNLIEEFDIDSQPVTVLQGWKLEDYLWHLDFLEKNNCLTDYIAIGSICRRGQDEEIRRIITEIDKRIGDRKLHAFGVKKNVLRFRDIRNKLDSADSNSFDYKSRYREETVNGDGSNGWRNIALSYLEMKKSINNLVNSKADKNQTTLERVSS